MFRYSLLLLAIISGLSVAQGDDPTRPLTSRYQNTKQLNTVRQYVVQSIIDNGQGKKAVINGKVMAIGDHIGAYQLSVIEKNFVVLSSPDKELKMSLFSSVVAK